MCAKSLWWVPNDFKNSCVAFMFFFSLQLCCGLAFVQRTKKHVLGFAGSSEFLSLILRLISVEPLLQRKPRLPLAQLNERTAKEFDPVFGRNEDELIYVIYLLGACYVPRNKLISLYMLFSFEPHSNSSSVYTGGDRHREAS